MDEEELKKVKRSDIFSGIVKQTIEMALKDLKQIQLECGSKDDYGQGAYNGLELARVSLVGGSDKFINKNFKVDSEISTNDAVTNGIKENHQTTGHIIEPKDMDRIMKIKKVKESTEEMFVSTNKRIDDVIDMILKIENALNKHTNNMDNAHKY